MIERIFGEKSAGVGMILAFGLGWMVAQGAKVVIMLVVRRGRVSFREVMEMMAKSGGMPSGHTASMVGMMVAAGMRLGFGSEVFAALVGVSSIVIYDAMNVRWAVGKQGEFLEALVRTRGWGETVQDEDRTMRDGDKLRGSDDELARALPERVVRGHTMAEVVVGGVIGAAIGVLIGLV